MLADYIQIKARPMDSAALAASELKATQAINAFHKHTADHAGKRIESYTTRKEKKRVENAPHKTRLQLTSTPR